MKIPFQKNALGNGCDNFCSNCFRIEERFEGGGSWSPDLCPCGCEDIINWKDMNYFQKLRAMRVEKEFESRERICHL